MERLTEKQLVAIRTRNIKAIDYLADIDALKLVEDNSVLLDEITALKAENARLRDELEKKDDEIYIHDMTINDGVELMLSGEPVRSFFAMLLQMLEQNGGENYLSVTLENGTDKYAITVQNCKGTLTPAEKIAKPEAENAALQKRLDAAKPPCDNCINNERLNPYQPDDPSRRECRRCKHDPSRRSVFEPITEELSELLDLRGEEAEAAKGESK